MRRNALLAALLALTPPTFADDLTAGLDPPAVQRRAEAAPITREPPPDVRALKEDPLLHPGKKPALIPVGPTCHPEREPLILVHGLNGDFADLQPLVTRYANDPRFQLYLLAYGDKSRRTSLNGDGFADELRALSTQLGPGRNLTIVAHSMGGLVTRRALNELVAGPTKGIDGFDRIRFVAIDSPWSGFAGPSDRGFAGFTMKIVAAFMPDGLEDMRGKSNMFRGDPRSSDDAARAGLFGVALPAKVETTLVFAEKGDQALDWTEKPLTPLAGDLVRFYTRGERVAGDQRVRNFWDALRSSRTFAAFDADMKTLAAAGTLDESAVRGALEEHFPRFEGDHSSVIAGERFLAFLGDVLSK